MITSPPARTWITFALNISIVTFGACIQYMAKLQPKGTEPLNEARFKVGLGKSWIGWVDERGQ